MGPRKQRANNAPAPSEWMAGGGGFEPPLRGPEPRVLPLDDPHQPTTRYNLTTPDSPAQAARLPARRAQSPQRIAVFSVRLGRKRGTRAGGILISLPVRGSRPLRAARLVTTNVPNPESVTRRPRRSDSTIPHTMASMARSAAIFEPPELFATITTRSALVTPPSNRARWTVSMRSSPAARRRGRGPAGTACRSRAPALP